jgi:hypothetical protein
VLELLRSLTESGRIVVVSTHDERMIPLADRVVPMSPHACPRRRDRSGRARRRRVRLPAGRSRRPHLHGRGRADRDRARARRRPRRSAGAHLARRLFRRAGTDLRDAPVGGSTRRLGRPGRRPEPGGIPTADPRAGLGGARRRLTRRRAQPIARTPGTCRPRKSSVLWTCRIRSSTSNGEWPVGKTYTSCGCPRAASFST